MSSILGNYLRARESSFFKTEQEAQLQTHRSRLIKEGKLDPSQPPARRDESFDASTAAYEVLPEVLGAQARVDDPDAARRKQFDRRVKGEAAPATEEELRRYRTTAYGMGAAVGHIPRISLSGRNRYAIHAGAVGAAPPAHAVRTLSPEAAEAARRGYLAGLRALVYGSVLGFALLAVGGTAAAQALGVGGGDAARDRIKAFCQPLAEGARAWAAPVRARAQAWLGPSSAAGAADEQASSEFQSRMQQRYNPGKGGNSATAL